MNKGWFKNGHLGYWLGIIRVPKKNKKCVVCKKFFELKPYRFKDAKFCSSYCYGISKRVGEELGYQARHRWVEKFLGKPKKCEICESRDPGRKYDWANKSHQYKLNLNDWLRLCRPCHRKYDNKYNRK